jgi:hypothetical protein
MVSLQTWRRSARRHPSTGGRADHTHQPHPRLSERKIRRKSALRLFGKGTPNSFPLTRPILNRSAAAPPASPATFISPHRPAAHLHPPNHLLGAIVRPGHILLPIKHPVAAVMLAQADQHPAQLTHGQSIKPSRRRTSKHSSFRHFEVARSPGYFRVRSPVPKG